MKIKPCNWINIQSNEKYYGISIYHNGKWHHAMENGKGLIYPSEEERNKKINELKSLRGNEQIKGRLCDPECRYLSPTEKEQNTQTTKDPHMCGKWLVRLYHAGHHPNIVKCEQCLKRSL